MATEYSSESVTEDQDGQFSTVSETIPMTVVKAGPEKHPVEASELLRRDAGERHCREVGRGAARADSRVAECRDQHAGCEREHVRSGDRHQPFEAAELIGEQGEHRHHEQPAVQRHLR